MSPDLVWQPMRPAGRFLVDGRAPAWWNPMASLLLRQSKASFAADKPFGGVRVYV